MHNNKHFIHFCCTRNIKKTHLMISGTATSLRIGNEDIEVVDSFCLKGIISQEMCHRLVPCGILLNTLEKFSNVVMCLYLQRVK